VDIGNLASSCWIPLSWLVVDYCRSDGIAGFTSEVLITTARRLQRMKANKSRGLSRLSECDGSVNKSGRSGQYLKRKL